MKFTDELQGIVARFKAGADGARDRYNERRADADAKLSAEFITPEGYEAMLREPTIEYNQAIADMTSEAASEVHAALDKYLDGLERRYTKTADNIDEKDISLLSNDAVILSESDIERMFSKHSCNPAMQQVISEYAQSHSIDADITFYTREARIASATDFAQGCLRAMREPDGLACAVYLSGRGVPADLLEE